ncbi:hypothetical protein MJH12_03870, partial [bacterium]|nr:hypothetical protein [bacterium]
MSAKRSFDLNRQALTYFWEIISKPLSSIAELNSTNNVLSSFVADVLGLYTIQLTVDDGTFQDAKSIVINVQNLSTLRPVLKDFVSSAHSCAIIDQGDLVCMGDSQFGETGQSFSHYKPIQLDTNLKILQIALSPNHSCLIDSKKEAYCFGLGTSGQLGNNSKKSSPIPTKVVSLNSLKQIAIANQHGCALNQGGNVFCFGDNTYNRVGLSSGTITTIPVQIQGLQNIEKIAVGQYHNCALDSSGDIYCFGYGQYGQLANQLYTTQSKPVKAFNGGTSIENDVHNDFEQQLKFKDLAVGRYFTCALSLDNEVYCAGDNSMGQLAQLGISSSNTFKKVFLKKKVKSLALGQRHACVKYFDRTVSCWGANDFQQISDRNNTRVYQAIPVFSNALQLELGANHTCIIHMDNQVHCIGDKSQSLLPISSTPISSIDYFRENINVAPVAIAGSDQNHAIGRILLNGSHSFDINDDLLSYQWSILQEISGSTIAIENSTSQIASFYVTLPGNYIVGLSVSDSSLTSISQFRLLIRPQSEYHQIQQIVSYSNTCLIVNQGEVYCKGQNSSGQLGFGDSLVKQNFEKVTQLQDIQNLDIFGNHSCAVSKTGRVYCSGNNSYGQLGSGDSVSSSKPVTVISLNKVKQVALGTNHTCALNEDGQVFCFGYNSNGQLGNQSTINSLSPTRVLQLDNVEKIIAGENNTCALLNDRNMKCFGYNGYKNLGDSMTTRSQIPVHVNLPRNKVVDIFAGNTHSCALTIDGELWCFGRNNYGQLGLKSNISSSYPQKISHPSPIKEVFLGNFSTCFIDQNAQLYCSGRNSNNKLKENQENSLFGFELIYQGSDLKNISLGNDFSCILKLKSLQCNGFGDSNRFQPASGFEHLNNSPPFSHKNSNIKHQLGLIQVSAALSYDLDDPLTYTWDLITPNGSSASMTTPSSKFSDFQADLAGEYNVSLNVSDGQNNNS